MEIYTATSIALDILDEIEHTLTPGRVVQALEVLEKQGGEYGIGLVEKILDLVPGYMNYDRDGNYMGP